MSIRLDIRAGDFAQRFRAFLDTKREAAADVDAAVARDHRRRRRPRRRRAHRLHAEIRPLRSRPAWACGSRPRRSPRRATPADARRSRRSELAARRASRPFTAASCRRTTAIDDAARRRARLALDGDRGGRALRAGRHRRLSVVGADERHAGRGRRRAARSSWWCRRRTARSTRSCWRPRDLAGVDEIYRIGGAQAIAALAYGTETIAAGRQDRRAGQRLCRRRQAPGVRRGRHRHDRRPVRGPGRRRRQRRSRLDRRRSAGAGRARHRRAVDPDHRRRGACRRASSGAVERQLAAAAARRDRRRVAGATSARSSWSPTLDRRVAAGRPHCRPSISSSRRADAERAGRRGSAMPARSSSARHTPEAIGDYVAGSNHVLPTARSARFSSGLGVLDFMKRTSILKCGPEQLARARPGGDRARRSGGSRRARAARSRSGSTGDERRRTTHRAKQPAGRGRRSTRRRSAAPTPTSSTSARSRSTTCSRRTRSQPVGHDGGPYALHLSHHRATGWCSTSARRTARR